MTPPTVPASRQRRRAARRPPSVPRCPAHIGARVVDARSAGRRIRHVSSTLSWRVNGALSPYIAAFRRTSYGVGPSPPSCSNSMSSVISSGPAPIGAVRVDDQADAGNRIELDDQLALDRRPAPGRRQETEPRRALEHQPDLGLSGRQTLAGADEPWHPGPAPVVDLEPQRGVGLGRRVRRDPVDVRDSRRTGRGRSAAGRRRASSGTRRTWRPSAWPRRHRRAPPSRPPPAAASDG